MTEPKFKVGDHVRLAAYNAFFSPDLVIRNTRPCKYQVYSYDVGTNLVSVWYGESELKLQFEMTTIDPNTPQRQNQVI